MKKYALGADVGGSHISCALIDLENSTIINNSRHQGEVNNKSDSESILKCWATILLKSMNGVDKREISGIGFGMPGPFDYAKGIAQFEDVDKYENLKGINISSQLQVLLDLDQSTPIRFMNDASAFAVGESWFGSAQNVDKSVSITLGTGFGSAFINEGAPVVKGSGVPKMGCVWHLPFKGGIADDSFSTRWFIKRYKEETGVEVNGARPIAEAAKTNPVAASIFSEFGTNLGDFLGPWLKDFDAKVLVIGGNVTGAYDLFGPSFEAVLLKQNVKVRIERSSLKEDAAIIGGARMMVPHYWKKIQPILPFM